MSTRNRAEIRRHLRAQRLKLSPAEQSHAARQVEHRVGHQDFFRRSRHIAFYFPNEGEIDPMPLLQRAWAMNKCCYLPVITPAQSLWFAMYQPDDDLILNQFGIPEPARPERLLQARLLDLILMPLVAFDTQGNRLGMGGGFYDRSLSFLRHRCTWHKPRLVGLAYEFQKLRHIESLAWDVPLDTIATETAVYHTGRRSRKAQ